MRRVRLALSALPMLRTPRGRRLARLGALGVLGLGVGVGAFLAARSEAVAEVVREAHRAVADAGADAGVRLLQVSVDGRHMTRGEDILGAIGIAQGEPLLAFEPAAARERLESLPWVKEATVERRLPETIFVRLVERTPIAVWQAPSGGFALVDADGAVIETDVSAFGQLPVIAGPGAPEAASDLFTMLAAEPEIAPRVKAAVRVGKRRWNVWLDAIGDGGLDIRLPEHGAPEALARLVALNRDQGLLRRDLAMIDLRLPDRLIVRLNETANQPATAGKGRAPAPALPLNGPAQDA
ncbi:cell division protein FtsQ/DivIB [Novispirillum sp. DQ9]|uniref:cell division protein FtsQ/DivIB n=1 Tax=Novispirillum sp. DQ9 TaxID=3398612 RepID=UPI003C7A6F7C